MNNICLIYNYAQHYRFAIFHLLDEKLHCDFYFGDKYNDLKKIDYKLLINFKKELKNVKLYKAIYWQKGAVSLFFRKYDRYIILGEYFCLSTWLILFLSKFSSRKKVFLWTHGWYGNEHYFKRIIKKMFYGLADGVFLYGNHAKKLMIAEGFAADRLHVIFNSLDYEVQIKIRPQLTLTNIYTDFFGNGNPVLIFIGRLTSEKKLDQLLSATSLLKERGIDLNVVMVGDGEIKGELMNQTILSNIQYRVWFFGACYDELKIAELIYNATLCVSPGNVGLTAMHTLVYGTPIVTHNDFSYQGPEFESIISGITGDFFAKDDIQELAEVIEKWLLDVEEREMVRKNCFKVIDSRYNPLYQFKLINEAVK